MTNVFPLQGNPAIIIFFTNPVFIKSKYEFIYSTHTLIGKSCSLYEASIYVGFFLKFTTGYQSKGSSIVALSKSSWGGTYHLPYVSPICLISACVVSFLTLFLISQKLCRVKEVEQKVEFLAYYK